MTISTIILAIPGVFGGAGGNRGGWGAGGSPPKDQEWLGSLANALKMLVEKAIKAVKAIVVSILGAILRFLKKTVGFVA